MVFFKILLLQVHAASKTEVWIVLLERLKWWVSLYFSKESRKIKAWCFKLLVCTHACKFSPFLVLTVPLVICLCICFWVFESFSFCLESKRRNSSCVSVWFLRDFCRSLFLWLLLWLLKWNFSYLMCEDCSWNLGLEILQWHC